MAMPAQSPISNLQSPMMWVSRRAESDPFANSPLRSNCLAGAAGADRSGGGLFDRYQPEYFAGAAWWRPAGDHDLVGADRLAGGDHDHRRRPVHPQPPADADAHAADD